MEVNDALVAQLSQGWAEYVQRAVTVEAAQIGLAGRAEQISARRMHGLPRSLARGNTRLAVRAGGISTGFLQTTQTIFENLESLKAERV
jgi:hypothetical protein